MEPLESFALIAAAQLLFDDDSRRNDSRDVDKCVSAIRPDKISPAQKRVSILDEFGKPVAAAVVAGANPKTGIGPRRILL